MSRRWIEAVATLSDVVPLPLLILLLILAASLGAALWYWFPVWLPRRWPRLRWRRPRWPARRRTGRRWRWPRLRWIWRRWRWPRLSWRGWFRRRRRVESEPAAVEVIEQVAAIPAVDFVSLADRLAAEGRFAEAVRERLRAMVRALIETGTLADRPGWTVSEVVRATAAVRPGSAAPMDGAARIFSDIWYGQRAATARDDADLRTFAGQLGAQLNAHPRATLTGAR
jgi:hypothetical protein